MLIDRPFRAFSGSGHSEREFRSTVWAPGTDGAFEFLNESPLSENRGVTCVDSNTLLRSERIHNCVSENLKFLVANATLQVLEKSKSIQNTFFPMSGI